MKRIFASVILFMTAMPALAQPYGPPPPPPPPPQNSSLDLYCRHEAAASTGYVTPRQAARQAQTGGAVGGLLGGAALGALLGGRHAGTGAAIGAGAGLVAGSAIGANNAQRAASDVERRYDDAYYSCLDANRSPPPDYIPAPNDAPPPPPPPRGQY